MRLQKWCNSVAPARQTRRRCRVGPAKRRAWGSPVRRLECLLQRFIRRDLIIQKCCPNVHYDNVRSSCFARLVPRFIDCRRHRRKLHLAGERIAHYNSDDIWVCSGAIIFLRKKTIWATRPLDVTPLPIVYLPPVLESS